MKKRIKEFISTRHASFWVIMILVLVIVISLVLFTPVGGKVQVSGDKEAEQTISEFKILGWECIRATNSIKGTIKNLNGAESPVTIEGKLYFAGQVISDKTITLYDVKIYEERDFEIKFDNPSTWNACNVEPI
ncbi:hypothetical protein ACFLZ7_03995 [Nanoarchaeota archaeon]